MKRLGRHSGISIFYYEICNYKEHIKRDGIKKAFEDYIMSVPSIFGIHTADCDIRYLLRSWGVEFDDDDDEIYILYKKIIREVFFKMCNDMNIRF